MDIETPIDANQQLLNEQAPMVQLLNGLTDERTPWQITQGRREYVDLFGVVIPRGSAHYKQGGYEDCIRLSASSMSGVLTATLSNHFALHLSQRTIATRRQQMADAMNRLENASRPA